MKTLFPNLRSLERLECEHNSNKNVVVYMKCIGCTVCCNRMCDYSTHRTKSGETICTEHIKNVLVDPGVCVRNRRQSSTIVMDCERHFVVFLCSIKKHICYESVLEIVVIDSREKIVPLFVDRNNICDVWFRRVEIHASDHSRLRIHAWSVHELLVIILDERCLHGNLHDLEILCAHFVRPVLNEHIIMKKNPFLCHTVEHRHALHSNDSSPSLFEEFVDCVLCADGCLCDGCEFPMSVFLVKLGDVRDPLSICPLGERRDLLGREIADHFEFCCMN